MKVATMDNIVRSCHRKKKLTLEKKCHLLALGEIQQAIQVSGGSLSWFQRALAWSHCFSQFRESIWFFDSRDWIERVMLILIMWKPCLTNLRMFWTTMCRPPLLLASLSFTASGPQELLVPICYPPLSEKHGTWRGKVPGDTAFRDLLEVIHIFIFLTYKF